MTRPFAIDTPHLAKRDERITRLWNSGLTTNQLGARFGLNAKTVSQILKRSRDRGEYVRPFGGLANTTRPRAEQPPNPNEVTR